MNLFLSLNDNTEDTMIFLTGVNDSTLPAEYFGGTIAFGTLNRYA